MRYWRWWLLSGLFSLPFFILMGCGVYYLWTSGWWIWAWWPLAACVVLALVLAWRWQRSRRLLRVDFAPALHWTERDQQAWQLIEARAKQITAVSMNELGSMAHYVDTAEKLALEMAQVYHPKAQDPFGSLTILEILAVVELAAHDLAVLMEQYLPGSHWLTINGWRKAQKAVGWYQTASKIGWVLAGLFNPVATGTRDPASQLGISKPWQKFQENVQLWFFHAYLHRLGAYLIELYGGRLRVGAGRYRELFGTPSGPRPTAGAAQPIALVLMGQSKAGKSSLINALLGEQKAATDVVHPTGDITSYELNKAGLDARLHIMDTVGYGHGGPRADQMAATELAAQGADVLLLALHVRNPGRQADLEMLQSLSRFFQAHPNLKKPPILAVLTHIDLLTPSLEWAPPYDWMNPQRTKERHIAQAVAAVQEQLGEYLLGVIPVCTAPGKEFGIEESLMPALATVMEEGRAVALVRCLRGEAESGKATKIVQQLLGVGGQLLKAWLQTSK